MRALFFLLDGETNASTKHRALQYFPYLRNHGIQPRAIRPVPEPAYQRLVEHGKSGATDKATFYSLFLACRLFAVQRVELADVVVVQRDLFPFGPPFLERLLARRTVHLVYDTDDATYLRPAFTPNTPFQRLRRFDKVAELVSQARWVSVASEPIAKSGTLRISAGVAELSSDDTSSDFFNRADEDLYRAKAASKQSGRAS